MLLWRNQDGIKNRNRLMKKDFIHHPDAMFCVIPDGYFGFGANNRCATLTLNEGEDL